MISFFSVFRRYLDRSHYLNFDTLEVQSILTKCFPIKAIYESKLWGMSQNSFLKKINEHPLY